MPVRPQVFSSEMPGISSAPALSDRRSRDGEPAALGITVVAIVFIIVEACTMAGDHLPP